MTSLLQDLRAAIRGLARTPGFTAVAVLSLGAGIGSVTTIYNWTDRFLLHPLPLVERAARLTVVKTRGPGGAVWSMSYPDYRDWAERSRVFDGLAATAIERVGVRFDQGVESAWTALVSENYFDVLGTRAALGRTFNPSEEREARPVAVLGHDYWLRRFSASPGVVGQRIVVNGHGFEVVGVMPPRFGGGYIGLNLDLYLPITSYPALFGGDRLVQRGSKFLEGIGRLAPGVTLTQAADDMRRVGRELDAIYPDGANEPLVMPITEQGPPATMRPVFLALLGVTAVVLLIACANVANLLLARATTRQREIGVRLALGAGRARLVRLLLVESALLALGGGVLGLGLAYVGRDALMALIPPTPFPIGMDFPISGRVVAVALALSTATVAVFGLWPALRASSSALVPMLKEQLAGARGRSTARSVLVVVQMALAVVSLASAGLFLRALGRAGELDPGFRHREPLLLLDSDLRAAGLDESTGPVVVDRILERWRAVPGVERVAAATFVPLGWSCCSASGVRVDGYEPREDENMSIVYALVTNDYLKTLGIELAHGRDFSPDDRADTEPVAIVNEAFVRRFWPGSDGVGRTILQDGRQLAVIGVARDGKYRELTETPFPLVYRLFGQSYQPALTLHVLARSGNPRILVETLRNEARAVHADVPVLGARTMSEHMMQSTVGQQIGSRTLAVFGALALLLSAVGLYGVMAYAVTQRTREIGVRVALGAGREQIARLVLGQSLRITAIGLLAGLALALVTGRLLQGLLLGVSPADPLTLTAVAAVLGLVAIAAALVPASRAARVDPVRAIRAE